MHNDNPLASAVAMLDERREIIVAAMARYIARPDRGTPTDEGMEAAKMLFDATLAMYSGSDAQAPLGLPANVDRYVSRFGDGLLPILKDVFGPDLPTTALSRMIDAYWRAINGIDAPAG